MRQAARSPISESETSTAQRVAVTAAGGTLLVLGLKRRTLPGYVAAMAGGWLAYRGIKGDTGREIELASLEGLEASAEAIDVQRTITIASSAEEVRAFLEEPANLDAVLGETGSVQALGEHGQRWQLATPLGGALSWDMQRVEDEDVLGWTSAEDTGLEVQIATKPATEQESEVTLHVSFEPPGGALGRAVLDRLDVLPHAIVGQTLRRARSLIETGELPELEPEPLAAREPRQTSGEPAEAPAEGH